MRNPNQEGEFEWGCSTEGGNNLAAVADTTQSIYLIRMTLYKRLQSYLESVVTAEGAVLDLPERGLVWLQGNAQSVLTCTVNEHNKCADDEENIKPTPEEAEDFFCWMYRSFKAWKLEQKYE